MKRAKQFSLKSIKEKPNQEIIPPRKPPHRFLPGNKMGGRPKGSRNKFAEQFFRDFHTDWEKHGIEALAACRKEDPATYCRIAATLIPKELHLKEGESILETFLEQFTDQQLDQLIAGLTALGIADSGKAGQTKALPRGEPNGVH